MSQRNDCSTQVDISSLDQELIRVRVRLLEIDDSNDPEWKRLYDVQQALAWARDPRSARSPYNMVSGAADGASAEVNCARPARSHAETALRMECLKLAVDHGGPSEAIVERASAFYAFIGEEPEGSHRNEPWMLGQSSRLPA